MRKNHDEEETLVDPHEPLAFYKFVQTVRTSALGYASSKTRNVDDAEDLLFEAFTKLHRGWDDEELKPYLLGWKLLRTAIDWCFIDTTRKKKGASLEAMLEFGEEPGYRLEHESSIILNQLLSKLHEDDRIMIVMDSEGYSNQEIAEFFDVTLATIKARLYRVQAELQQAFLQGKPVRPGKAIERTPWYTVFAAAAVLAKGVVWTLNHLREMKVEYRIKPTVRGYQWPHISEVTLRKLRKIAKEEARHIPKSILWEDVEWRTSKSMSRILGHDEGWVLRRLVPFLGFGEFRLTRGRICLCYPPEVFTALKQESEAQVPAADWLTIGAMADKLGRHGKWVEWRLPKLMTSLGVKPEWRLDKTGKVSEHWPPEVFATLKEEVDKYPDKGNWVSRGELMGILKKDWQWIDDQLELIEAESRELRIPGSGKVFDHYPPEVVKVLKAAARQIKRAPRGWYTAQGMEAAEVVGKSHHWLAKRIPKVKKVRFAIYGDDHMVPRIFYAPSVVRSLRTQANNARKVPSVTNELSVRQIATALRKSQGWTRKHLGKVRAREYRRTDGQGRIRVFYKPKAVTKLRRLLKG